MREGLVWEERSGASARSDFTSQDSSRSGREYKSHWHVPNAKQNMGQVRLVIPTGTTWPKFSDFLEGENLLDVSRFVQMTVVCPNLRRGV